MSESVIVLLVLVLPLPSLLLVRSIPRKMHTWSASEVAWSSPAAVACNHLHVPDAMPCGVDCAAAVAAGPVAAGAAAPVVGVGRPGAALSGGPCMAWEKLAVWLDCHSRRVQPHCACWLDGWVCCCQDLLLLLLEVCSVCLFMQLPHTGN